MKKPVDPVVLTLLDHYKWRLEASITYNISENDNIVVPKGYVTDLASVPRFLWWWLPPHGRYAKAAIVHDFMYENALRTKQEADMIFYDLMRILGVPKTKAWLMYKAVCIFGKGKYVK